MIPCSGHATCGEPTRIILALNNRTSSFSSLCISWFGRWHLHLNCGILVSLPLSSRASWRFCFDLGLTGEWCPMSTALEWPLSTRSSGYFCDGFIIYHHCTHLSIVTPPEDEWVQKVFSVFSCLRDMPFIKCVCISFLFHRPHCFSLGTTSTLDWWATTLLLRGTNTGSYHPSVHYAVPSFALRIFCHRSGCLSSSTWLEDLVLHSHYYCSRALQPVVVGSSLWGDVAAPWMPHGFVYICHALFTFIVKNQFHKT